MTAKDETSEETSPEEVVRRHRVQHLVKRLSRARSTVERETVLRKIAAAATPDDEPLSGCVDRVESHLLAAIRELPSAAAGQAATALLLHTGVKLWVRQEEAGQFFAVTWESFRKRYEERLLNAVADRLLDRLTQEKMASSTGLPDSEGQDGDGAAALKMTQVAGADHEASAKHVLESLATVENAVLLVGDLLLVKTGSTVVGKTLSHEALSALAGEKSTVLRDPARALEFLLESEDNHRHASSSREPVATEFALNDALGPESSTSSASGLRPTKSG